MVNTINRLDPQLAFQHFGDRTDRIANGELPFAQPPRQQGIERNIVLTLWHWSRRAASGSPPGCIPSKPGFLQAGIDRPLGAGLPALRGQSPSVDVRPDD